MKITKITDDCQPKKLWLLKKFSFSVPNPKQKRIVWKIWILRLGCKGLHICKCLTACLFFIFFFQSNEYESPTGDLRYGHAFDSRCAKHSPAVSPNASSPVLSELDRTPDCGCQVRILSWYSYIISYNHTCFLFSFFFCMTCLQLK